MFYFSNLRFFLKNDNIPLTPRFEIWSGWLLLLPHKYINFKNNMGIHYYGLFEVYPLPINVSGV